MNGKLVVYPNKGAAEQLRAAHGISCKTTSREILDGVLIVTVEGMITSTGRRDDAIGAVSVGNLKGEALAVAYMKAETKAKRRVTLALTGLGAFDNDQPDNTSNQNSRRYDFPDQVVPELQAPTEAERADSHVADNATSETREKTATPASPIMAMASSVTKIIDGKWDAHVEAHRKLVGQAAKALGLKVKELKDKDKLEQYLTNCEPTLEEVTTLMKEFYDLQ